MNEKLRNHIEMLFEKAPKTRKTFELKEELLANSIEKYQDLITDGYSEENAFKNVISSIGDVSMLFNNLELNEVSEYESAEAIKKRAIIKTIAVGIYFFAGVVFFGMGIMEDMLPENVEWSAIGFIIAIVICIAPTCMLVYLSNLTPKYIKKEETVVEEFKEWQNEKSNKKEIKTATYSIVWTLTLVLYFTISFLTRAWYITWVLFLVAACVNAVIGLLFSIRK